ncbi:MAG TPA: PHB depolymerase family esterase [Alphaproteobacteria bacterium]|nr:PHB depolymerase family esterase [Alphaproteobacteria bacterium]
MLANHHVFGPLVRRVHAAALAVVFAAGGGAAGAAQAGRDLSQTIEHGGITRSYILHLPPAVAGAKLPMPLVIALHAGGGRAAGFARFTGFSALADKAGFAVVYPQGVERHWNDGRTRSGFRAHAENIDDVGFLVKVIAALRGQHGISGEQVYIAGAANGGIMAMRMACEAADQIHGVAAVMANFPDRMRFRCAPKRPVSVLVMNGTVDPIVPWRGGEMRSGFRRLGKLLSTEATVEYWAAKNGCSDAPLLDRLPDKAPADGTEVRRERYQNCARGSRVVLYTIDRGGHTWPGGQQYQPEVTIGKVSRDIVAQDAIWAFFRTLPRGSAGSR